MTEIRRCRHILKQSQREFAHTLGVGIEAYRTWDAGRRTTPDSVLLKARTLIETGRDVPVARRVLAGELHVNVRTLRAAAQDGRLAATFGARPYFGKIAAMSTRTAATQFMAVWYRQTYGRGRRPRIPVCRIVIPLNYAAILVGLRRRLGVSQRELALRIGAAGKAVVCQWESGNRQPSRVFWMRIVRLQRRITSSAGTRPRQARRRRAQARGIREMYDCHDAKLLEPARNRRLGPRARDERSSRVSSRSEQ